MTVIASPPTARRARAGSSTRRSMVTLAIACAVSALCTPPARAGTDAHPYQGIIDRNVFALREVPHPPPLPATPPPRIILTGITTILGNKRVLMKLDLPARPPQPAIEKSLILAEGGEEAGVKVLAVDVAGGRVKVINQGVEQELTFEKNGPTVAAAAPQRPAPGILHSFHHPNPQASPHPPAGWPTRGH